MSIFNWINKIFNIDTTEPSSELPSEFLLPTENADNINANMDKHNSEINNFTVAFNRRNQLEDDMNNMFRLIEFEILNLQNHTNGSDISEIMTSQPINQEHYSRIPKKNFLAQSVFLNPNPDSRSLDEHKDIMNITINNIGSQYFGKSCRSFKSRNSDGRIIEKETCTKQLQNGITETVTVMKEGDKKYIETITENSKTGETTENIQLSNLDKSQLNEFKNQFSKL